MARKRKEWAAAVVPGAVALVRPPGRLAPEGAVILGTKPQLETLAADQQISAGKKGGKGGGGRGGADAAEDVFVLTLHERHGLDQADARSGAAPDAFEGMRALNVAWALPPLPMCAPAACRAPSGNRSKPCASAELCRPRLSGPMFELG